MSKLHPRSSVALALLVLLLACETASAQIIIAGDQTVVLIGRQRPLPIGGSFTVGPVVVGPGRRFVRVGGTFSGFFVNPNRGFLNGPAFIKPFTPNARARLSNFYGAPAGFNNGFRGQSGYGRSGQGRSGYYYRR